MRQFFSTILSQIYSRKKIILGGLAIAMLFSFVPFQIAQAGLTGIIVGAILNVLNLGLTAILIPIAALVELVFKADSALLAVIISGLAGMTVTPGLATTPSFVLEGWRISQNLVNIVFILILTFIGLATILRLQTYQLQKTLPSLIIIALLVNFSGLLVGFVTDIGNILTKVFIGKGLFSGDLLGFTFTLSPAGNVAKILFYFIAILILFIIALMFIVRMVILWMLVILAPLAFGAYILPATKKYWTQWFGALIQWSLFTIPIAFFMYLARLILQDKVFDWSSLGFFSGAFPPITALILLFLGITLSMQMAPAGAQGVINFAKKLPKRITETRLGAKAAAWGASKTQGMLSATAKLSETKGVGGIFARPLGWAAKGTNRLAGGKLLEYAASKRRMTLPKNFDQMSEPELEAWAKTNNLGNEDLVQLAARMQDKKKYKHTTQAFKDRVNEAAENVSSQRWLHPDLGALKDVVPETVTRKLLEDMVVLEKAPESKTEEEALRKKFRESIAEEADKLSEEAGKNAALQEQVDIEAGLNQKIVTRNEVSADRTAALAKARTQLSDAQKRSALEDLAAAKMYAVDLKPGDISNILNPTSLAFSLAVPDANPETLHRLFASFEKDKVEKVLNTPGGLNDRSNTKEKLIKLQKSNPRLTRAIFNSSGYQHIDLEARKVLREEFGDNYKRFLDQTSPQAPKPMPFRANEIDKEIQQRQQELTQLQTLSAHTKQQRKRIQQLNAQIPQLQAELLQEQQQEQFEIGAINEGLTDARIMNERVKHYTERERSKIQEQLKSQGALTQEMAKRTGTTVEDATKTRTRDLFDRALKEENAQSYLLGKKIRAAERAVFEEVAQEQQRGAFSTDLFELGGGLHTLLEKIRAAEERINTNPAAVPQAEWRNLEEMKNRVPRIEQRLRNAVAVARGKTAP